MIGINAFSVIDLLAVIISTHVMLVFFYRFVRVVKRQIDGLFALLMVFVWCQGVRRRR